MEIIMNDNHIVPRSFGGTNEEENLILLTAQEHFIAHLLLAEFSIGEEKSHMIYALNLMIHGKKGNLNVSAKQYNHLKSLLKLGKSDIVRNNMSAAQKKWRDENPRKIVPDEVKEKMSESHKGKIKNQEHIDKIFEKRKNNGEAWHNEETKNKISQTLKKRYESGEIKPSHTFEKGSKPWNSDPNRKFSDESKEKMRQSHLGKKLTKEQIEKRSETRRKNGWNKKKKNG